MHESKKKKKKAPVTGETTGDELKTLCSIEKLKLLKTAALFSCLDPTPWCALRSHGADWIWESHRPSHSGSEGKEKRTAFLTLPIVFSIFIATSSSKIFQINLFQMSTWNQFKKVPLVSYLFLSREELNHNETYTAFPKVLIYFYFNKLFAESNLINN